jgi:hypothetical protein
MSDERVVSLTIPQLTAVVNCVGEKLNRVFPFQWSARELENLDKAYEKLDRKWESASKL